jgi:hypothetical protein
MARREFLAGMDFQVVKQEFLILCRREQWIMNSVKYLLYINCFFAVVFVSGCIVVSDRPIAVEVEEIEIGCPPPPPPPMVIVKRPPRPSRFHIWIEGRHIVRSGKWVWVSGHWARPARSGATWVPGHTRRSREVWIWRPGRWH